MDLSDLRPRQESHGAGVLFIAALLSVALASRARALEFIPEEPDHCDTIAVSVKRSFTSDCGWSASAETSIEEKSIEIVLTVGRLSERCLPFSREHGFQVIIGALPAGEYDVHLTWADRPELSETARLEVSEGICRGFIRGDVNGDLQADISDGIGILTHLFLGKTLDCFDTADADGSGAKEVTDAIFLFNFLFSGGPAPPSPFPECGTRPEGSPSLGCESTYCDTGHVITEELVWMSRPDGCFQCLNCHAPSLEDIVRGLEESGVEVEMSSFIFLLTCLACDVCPSGRNYLVLVTASDALTLAPLGWTRWIGEGN